MNNSYAPEGYRLGSADNREYLTSFAGLERAMHEGKILESTVLLCDSAMRLHVDLFGIRGVMERCETVYCREGEEIKDIAVITRVGKPVCFKVMGFAVEDGKEIAILSRRAAQQECLDTYLDELRSGDIIEAKVTHLDNFGAFVFDFVCGGANFGASSRANYAVCSEIL